MSTSFLLFLILHIIHFSSAVSTSNPTVSSIQPPDWVKYAHIVFSNHLDVGFDGVGSKSPSIALTVINKYFDEYFPLSIEIAHNLTRDHNLSFSWMTQSWLISLYLDCPSPFQYQNVSLHCPTASQVLTVFNEGIKKGIIYWHAFPFNAQLEIYDESMIEFGLQLSRDCSHRFGAPVSNTLSQRDVPGVTKSVIPILKRNNVSAISIGVNGGSAPPGGGYNIFRWKYNEDLEDSILTLVHPGSYGGVMLKDTVYLEHFEHALVMAWNDDNAGPPPVSKVLDWYNQTAFNFPNAEVFASSFTEFVDILKDTPSVYDTLPMVEGEMGDAWSFGIQSDPYKLAAHRIAQRHRSECIRSGKCSLNDSNFYNFSRLLLKNGEHTFGGDVKKYLNAGRNESAYYFWTNQQLRAGLASNGSINNLTNLRATWYEQRWIGLDSAVNALLIGADAEKYVDLHDDIIREWKSLINVRSPLDSSNRWKLVIDAARRFNVTSKSNGRHYVVQFDVKQSGGISSLLDVENGIDYVGGGGNTENERNIFGEFIYQTLTEEDFRNYIDSCWYRWRSSLDYGKYQLDEIANFTKHQYVGGQFRDLYILEKDDGNEANTFLVEMDLGPFQEDLVRDYGAMERIFVVYDFNAESATFTMELVLINKTYSRMPETLYFTFKPKECRQWTVDKIGSAVDIGNMMKNGSYHLHGVIGNTSCDLENGSRIDFHSVHSGLVTFKPQYTNSSSPFYNEFTVFPTPLVNASESDGLAYILGNNAWGTNYAMWYPFDPINFNQTFKFEIHLPL